MSAANARRRDRKTYSFSMTVTDLVWAGAGGAFALTVFFLFGVLVGRGYVPVETVSVAVEGSPAAMAAHGEAPAAEAEIVVPDESAEQVLKPEELGYQDQLARSGAEPAPAAQAAEQGVQAAAETVAEAAETAAEGAEAAAEAAEETPEAAPEQAAGYDPNNLPAPEPGEQIFAYTYQAAAFKDKAAAEDLAKKLQAVNIPAQVNEGKASGSTWYRVRMPFTGTPSQTRALRDAAEAVTGEKPVMVSKKAAQ